MNGSRQHLISLKKVNEPFNCRFFSVKSITVHCSWLIFNFSNKTPFMCLTKITYFNRKLYRCLHTLFWQVSNMTMEWLIRFILTSLGHCKQDLEVHVGCEEVKVVEGYKTIWKLFKITTSYFIRRRVCKWIFSSTICRSLISKIFE